MNTIREHLSKLYVDRFGKAPDMTIPIQSTGGSGRKYFRLTSSAGSAIGAWNPVKEENKAFLYLSQHFRAGGLHVPEVFADDEAHDLYLVEDLGDTDLLSVVDQEHKSGNFPGRTAELYKKILSELVRFQVVASSNLNYSLCYPRGDFDKRSMYWDLNYFKYYFLKLNTEFNEEKLEDDFQSLLDFLSEADAGWFMYRDFQARNIFLKDGEVFFIDYQGGRKGPLQYDVASLLFQVKASLPPSFREQMLEFYLDELEKRIPVNRRIFKEYYNGFVLLRILQVLGAYGFRGLIENKPHFRQSIPGALENLDYWLKNIRLSIMMPELERVLQVLAESGKYDHPGTQGSGRLTVAISSFSYKYGLPEDRSGNGGGFVFDCRALPNPGREEQYRAFNGKDTIIRNYLEKYPEVKAFLGDAAHLVTQSVDNYLERGFENLSVYFGCTGGQHRSVYCSEKLASFLREKYPQVIVTVEHPMLSLK